MLVKSSIVEKYIHDIDRLDGLVPCLIYSILDTCVRLVAR